MSRGITEAEFQQRILDLAMMRGWKVCHFRPARTERGWRTPIQGNKGFPDLVLARRGTVIFAELKAERGNLSTDQEAWGIAIGPRFLVWRPSDWPEVQKILEVA